MMSLDKNHQADVQKYMKQIQTLKNFSNAQAKHIVATAKKGFEVAKAREDILTYLVSQMTSPDTKSTIDGVLSFINSQEFIDAVNAGQTPNIPKPSPRQRQRRKFHNGPPPTILPPPSSSSAPVPMITHPQPIVPRAQPGPNQIIALSDGVVGQPAFAQAVPSSGVQITEMNAGVDEQGDSQMMDANRQIVSSYVMQHFG